MHNYYEFVFESRTVAFTRTQSRLKVDSGAYLRAGVNVLPAYPIGMSIKGC
jgi:hypothetical protein